MKKAGVSFTPKPDAKKKQALLMKQLEGKIDPGFLKALAANKQLASLAAAAKKAKMLENLRINGPGFKGLSHPRMVGVHNTAATPISTNNRKFGNFDQRVMPRAPDDEQMTWLSGTHPRDKSLAKLRDSARGQVIGDVITNTDSSTNSSTIMIFQDHKIGSGNNSNVIQTESGEIWSW